MEISLNKHLVVTCKIVLVLLSIPPPHAVAQEAGTGTVPVSSGLEINKTMTIVFAVLITAFFVFGIFSFYKRRLRERRFRFQSDGGGGVPSPWRAARGLDPSIIATFPILVYSTVKGLQIGKNSLECAICLNEFENSDKLRLIPNCSHVFHSDCVDAWLVSNSTCPVCRADLCPNSGQVTFSVVNSDRFERIGAVPSPPSSRPVSIPSTENVMVTPTRSNSTGDERYTLRLPEAVRSELMNSVVNRSRSLAEFSRERSVREGYRSGNGDIGRWRSFLRRTSSVPASVVDRTTETDWSPVVEDAGERSFARLRAT